MSRMLHSDPPPAEFSQITTIQGLPPDHIVLRYGHAIREYLKALLSDEEDVNHVAMEIFTKILTGQLSSRDPALGRFRDYLKVIVGNAATDRLRKRRRRPQEVFIDDLGTVAFRRAPGESATDRIWIKLWRETLVQSAVQKLEAYEISTPGNVFASIIRILEAQPGLDSTELASALTQETGKPFTPDNARQQKHRAQAKFAEFIVEETMLTLDHPSVETVEDELRFAGVFGYVSNRLDDAFEAVQRRFA